MTSEFLNPTGGEQRPVSGLELGSRRLAAQDGELVAQDEDLKILAGIAAGEEEEQLDGPAQRQVGKSWQHWGGLRSGRPLKTGDRGVAAEARWRFR
jgi:hypothetical protein